MGRRAAGDERAGHHRRHHPGDVHRRADTTHQVTSPRITINGDTARLTALVEAQHLAADPGTHALLKNPYTVDLVRDGDLWCIRRMRIENTWLTGDPVAIFGL